MLNRTKIIEIVKNLIVMNKENNDSSLYCEYLENVINSVRVNVDDSVYNETELVYLLLKNYKYYEISDVIYCLYEKLNEIKETDKHKNLRAICTIIIGYLNEFIPTINRIVNIEVDAHINRLLRTIFMEGFVENQKVINILNSYSFEIEKLSGISIADSIWFEQISMTKEKREDNRDKISFTSYTRSRKIEKENKSLIRKYFTLDELQQIYNRLNDMFANLTDNKRERENKIELLNRFKEYIEDYKKESLSQDDSYPILNFMNIS